jgi:TIR domain-containing protein
VRLFLSYRRTDDRHLVGRLRDFLVVEFGEENVFLDVESMVAGMDFRDAIREHIDRVDVMFAMIGPHWDPSRLASVQDSLRIELAEAFQQGKPIIPVLMDGASMPSPDELPAELERLAYKHADVIRTDPDFRGDAARLAHAARVAHERADGAREQALTRVRRQQIEVDGVRRPSEAHSPIRTPLWRRWPVWAAAGALVAILIVLLVVPDNGNSPKQVTVNGAVPWTDTGIEVSVGDQIEISADGTIRHNKDDPSTEVSPDGDTRSNMANSRLNEVGVGLYLTPPLHGGLIGKIGEDDGAVFGVGAHVEHTAERKGRLYLGINDYNEGKLEGGVTNNEGSFRAFITVTPG